jgi:hypothetical protein
MRRPTMKKTALLSAFLLSLALLAPGPNPGLFAQTKLQNSPGGYHGELDFPISWKRYYAYDELQKILRDLAAKYPHLADLQTIGKSRMGRDQTILILTSKSSGPAADKPAMWVDGAIHGNEINGVTCALYTAWYLLTRYDYDSYVHGLLETTTFYILPGMNVDANDSYAKLPNTANNPREPYRPEDDDGDGLLDEDQTEDVDGDGELSMMYAPDSKGGFKLTSDGRRFVRVTDPADPAPRFRMIGSEGFDNDGDGRINEDDLGGPDPNRNFPFDWSLQNGEPYPLSEPETRNVMTFWLGRPNIFASFHFHNTGRLIMFATPQASRAAAQMTPEQRQQQQERVRLQLEEMRKTNKYAQLFDRVVDRAYQADLNTQTEIVTAGARILKDYRPTIIGMVGQAQANSYFMFGRFAYLIELWGSPPDADEDGDGRVSEEEMMHWIDFDLTGEGWVKPHQIRHPDLGEVWIGGTAKKHITRTPPSRYMEDEAIRQALFILYCASQFPRVEIGEVNVVPATADLAWVEVTVKNDRVYPTSSDRAIALRTAVMDKLTFGSSSNISLIPISAGPTSLDLYDPSGRADAAAGPVAEFRLLGKASLRFRYLVKIGGGEGWIELSTASKFGGKDRKRITVKTS